MCCEHAAEVLKGDSSVLDIRIRLGKWNEIFKNFESVIDLNGSRSSLRERENVLEEKF